jgi:hypothetical protein
MRISHVGRSVEGAAVKTANSQTKKALEKAGRAIGIRVLEHFAKPAAQAGK